MADTPKTDEITGIETTGHDWDGIEELNNPLPRWWLWTFYFTIAWGVLYCIAYPAWPLINGATSGILGFSTRADVAADIARVEEQNAEIATQLASADLTTIESGTDLHNYAFAGGAAVFRAHCSQCHGSGAAGAKGYPNLLDDDWLWGGSVEDIEYSVRHGIRNEVDEDARYSEMPAFGEIFSDEEVAAAANYVLSLAGNDHDASLLEDGGVVFADNCASCHGEAGEGVRELGAPALNDAIWLYGGDMAAVTETITNARFGVMPAWGPRLSETEIKAVALYVHELGGGE